MENIVFHRSAYSHPFIAPQGLGHFAFSPDFGLHVNTRKKAINDRYIDLLQMGWFTADTKIRFRLGHNQTIVSLLEDPNLIYILDKYEAELTKDKIKSTETEIVVWLGRPIPE